MMAECCIVIMDSAKSISIKQKYLSFSGVYGFIRIMLLPRMPDFTQQLLTVAKL